MRSGSSQQSTEQSSPLVVWRVIDGKPGHESQTRGLVDALARRTELRSFDLPTLGTARAIQLWLRRRFPDGEDLPTPDLILGAGHRTHWAMLAARRARGGRAVVLMRPSLPCAWFDLCLIPEHDGMHPRENVVRTEGVLNPIRPAIEASPHAGLILIGGPSAHYGWDSASILDQVRKAVEEKAEVDWTLTTSRRTPPETQAALIGLRADNLEVVPLDKTGPGWVGAQLERCASVWVSEDSVSMVFEALTAGARVGLLRVPRNTTDSRVGAAMDSLRQRGRVIEAGTLEIKRNEAGHVSEPLAEADRCAADLLDRFFAYRPQTTVA